MNTIGIDLVMLSFHRQVLTSPLTHPPPPPPPPPPYPSTARFMEWKPIRVRRSNLSPRCESYRNPFVSKEAIFTSARVLTNQADERRSMSRGPWTAGVTRGHLVFLLLLPPPSYSSALVQDRLRRFLKPPRALSATLIPPGVSAHWMLCGLVQEIAGPLPDDAVHPK